MNIEMFLFYAIRELAFDYSLETWEAIYLPYYNWFEEVLNEAVKKEEVIKQLNVKWTAKTMINLIENAAELFYIGREQRCHT